MHQENLFFEVFDKKFDDPASTQLLRELVKKYPYFTAPHYFLLKKTETGTGYYNQIAVRTALHFDNPFMLNYRLNEKDESDQDILVTVESKIPEENKKDIETNAVTSPLEKMNLDPAPAEKPIEKIKQPAEKSDEPLLFEPLYATDYFASQGIKLTEEVQPGDKLGKQLKSFTEWLKSMKKVHEGKDPAANVPFDLSVQNLADKSNREEDILTESMAIAYLQQGKKQKAIEIFEKLSLQNPAKSAYFAAKIQAADATDIAP